MLLQAQEGDFNNCIITAFPAVTRDMLLMGTHITISFTPTETIHCMRRLRFPKMDGCIRLDSLKYVKEEFKYRQTQTVYSTLVVFDCIYTQILLCCK
jgi:hypothetical protein